MNPGRDISLEDLKTWNHSLVNALRTEKVDGGYIDPNGIIWSTTQISISNLNAICTLIALGAVTTSQVWRDKNNNNRTLTPTQLVQLAGGMMAFIKYCYMTSWTHKENIDSSTDINALLDYDITTGWLT